MSAEEMTPAEIGGYRLLRLLGAGGMGRVFEAESADSGQKVAVKLLSSQLTRNPTSVERFRQEGRLASQLSHPRCVFVYAADTENGRPYIVMELMPGETVKDLIDRRGPLPPQEAIQLIVDVIDGLQEAHRFGVIHRDVKPSNCFLMPDGRVKIGDFGLSKSLGNDGGLTQTGAFLGTVLYASPEQIRGEAVEYASDVYSVCATLFHMLTGRPAFQHENITAALAKIISEDAPAVRSIKPDVPRALGRVVERGLERDRARRWQTLDELREALVALVPSHLSYGGLTVRVGAYLLDEIIVRLLLVLPLAAIVQGLIGSPLPTQTITLIVLPVYFILVEGKFGGSFGKRLMRLRVCKIGSTDPPGLKAATVRTICFYLLVMVTLYPARVLLEAGGAWGLLAIAPFITGLLLLIVPMRKANDFRGLHEMVSGTCVMKLPRRKRPLALVSSRGNRILNLPPARLPLPPTIGPYAVRGGIPLQSGAAVLAEDTLLGRHILIQLRAPAAGAPFANSQQQDSITRPTRARFLQRGEIDLGSGELEWNAYVAPSGAALTDIAGPNRRLSWSETRPLLEQLAEELRSAQREGSLPAILSLDQIWVMRDGRLQLLDDPVPRPGEQALRSNGPLDLLRDTATLALEGSVRLIGSTADPIRAPVPLHAVAFLDRLLGNRLPFGDIESCAEALKETRELPTQVDQPLRLAHLTVQSAALGIGLACMFLVSGLFAVVAVLERDQRVQAGERLLQTLDDPDGRQRLQSIPSMESALTDIPRLREALIRQVTVDRTEADRMRESLNVVTRGLNSAVQSTGEFSEVETAQRALKTSTTPDRALFERFGDWKAACTIILFWPFTWAAVAFALRGGFSFLILGIVIVDRNGRPVRRRTAALRTLAVWLPIALLLCASAWVQVHYPAMVNLHSMLWFVALLLLPVYLGVALAQPHRPPQDRLFGTVLVPR
jgi:uncharacterized RDD family membrane protein YckC